METWAHGQDIVDTTGDAHGRPTERLRHVADLGYPDLRVQLPVTACRYRPYPIRVELDGTGRRRLDLGSRRRG